MTVMSFLLLIILFLVFFIYFSGLNPQDITVFYFGEHSLTTSAAILVLGSVVLGLALGYAVHLYGVFTHMFKHWRGERELKRAREVAAIYRDGVGRLLSGDLKKAHSLLQKALERDPARVESYIALANVYLQEGNASEGISLLLKAKGIDPKSLEVLFKLATSYEETGQDDEAIATYQAILNQEDTNRKALRALRNLQMKHGRWPEALELQKRVLKAGPGSNRLAEEKQLLLNFRYEVARQSLADGDIDQAKSELKEILKEAPEFVPARVSLGDAYRAQGRQDNAVAAWKEGYAKLGKSIFLSRLEDAFMEAEDPSTLLSFYKETLLNNPNDLLLRLFFGKFCLRLEMVDEALEQLFAVESSGIETRQLHLLLAEAHRRRNRLSEAMSEYQKALGIETRLRLGYVCEVCEETTPEWLSRCPECGSWGSFSLVDRQLIQAARPMEIREIHHGQRQ